MKSLAIQSLKQYSIEAARLWKEITKIDLDENNEDVENLLLEVWQAQTEQEKAVDLMAEIAEQLDAEITAVKARMECLLSIHRTALDKLTIWREKIDQTIINLSQQGLIQTELSGQTRHIKIKENPPTCEILIAPEQLPQAYQRIQTKVYADKKAITTAWKKGIPVEGTRIYQKQKVVYELLKSL